MSHLPTYQDDEDDWYATVICAVFGFAVFAFVIAMAVVSAIFNWHLFTYFSL
jgi:hypothetical protein